MMYKVVMVVLILV